MIAPRKAIHDESMECLSMPTSLVGVPREGIEKAVSMMERGRLCRYQEGFEGVATDSSSEAYLLERDFAFLVGRKYVVALNSCSSALFVALKCLGVDEHSFVLVNGFTLAPVPGAIVHTDATPMLVECTADCVVDLKDLELKMKHAAVATTKVFLCSHMRGHISDMDSIDKLCRQYGFLLIEDCAHTLGASSSLHAKVSCYSFQSNKHINAGEGGMLVTNDPDLAAQAILYSGSYMHYEQHGARPIDSAFFDKYKYTTPNLSLRMPELTAAIARSQIPFLSARIQEWNQSSELLANLFHGIEHIRVVDRQEKSVGSSIQFQVLDIPINRLRSLVETCSQRGLEIHWFGCFEPSGYISNWKSWRFANLHQDLWGTQQNLLDRLCDMPIPLGLTEQDAVAVSKVLEDALDVALTNDHIDLDLPARNQSLPLISQPRTSPITKELPSSTTDEVRPTVTPASDNNPIMSNGSIFSALEDEWTRERKAASVTLLLALTWWMTALVLFQTERTTDVQTTLFYAWFSFFFCYCIRLFVDWRIRVRSCSNIVIPNAIMEPHSCAHFLQGFLVNVAYTILYLIGPATFVKGWASAFLGWYLFDVVDIVIFWHELKPSYRQWIAIHHVMSFIVTGFWRTPQDDEAWSSVVIAALGIWLTSDLWQAPLFAFRQFYGHGPFTRRQFMMIRLLAFFLERIHRLAAYACIFFFNGDIPPVAWMIFFSGLAADALDITFTQQSIRQGFQKVMNDDVEEDDGYDSETGNQEMANDELEDAGSFEAGETEPSHIFEISDQNINQEDFGFQL